MRLNLSNLNYRIPDKNPKCSAVILAAGKGERMGFDKTMANLAGKPVIIRAIEPFQICPMIDEIVVVTSNDKIQQVADLCKEYRLDKITKVVCGGATRAESSLAGVCETRRGAKLIAIHDCARPLVSMKLIIELINAAKLQHAVVPGIVSVDTLKSVDSQKYINGKINRDEVVRVQTPQIFEADIIKGALTDAVNRKISITDDSSAVERLGFKVKIIDGENTNIKLTTKDDMIIAESIIRGEIG